MKRLPRVPNILKIPKRSKLSYSGEEFDALKVSMIIGKAAYVSGFGGRNYVKGIVPKMLSTPLDMDTISYRQDFFAELMSNEGRRKSLKKITQDLPDREYDPERLDFFHYESRNSLALTVERLLNFPLTLERLVTLGGDSGLYNDVRRFSRNLLGKLSEYIELTDRMRKEHPPRNVNHVTREKEVDRENLRYVAGKLAPFLGLVNVGKKLKEQLNTYLLFAYLCKHGCKPEFLDPKKREGHIIGAFHSGYGERVYDRSIGRWGKDVWQKPVLNDVHWDSDKRLTLVTGANSRGKSVYLRTIGINILLAMNGFYALADEMQFSPVRRLWPCFDFGDKKGAGHLETGQEYVARMSKIATWDDYLLIDEPSQGTEPAVEYELAKGLIKFAHLGRFNSSVVTHDIDLVREFEGSESVSFRRVAGYRDKKNKYRLLEGIAKGGYGIELAKKLGTDPKSLEKRIKQRLRKKQL